MPRTNWAAFISYSRRDKRLARQLHATLEMAGLRTWKDSENIQAGDQLTNEIKSAMAESACVVLLLSEAANLSKWVQKEIELAVELDKPILIVSIRNVAPTQTFPEKVWDMVRINAGASLIQTARKEIVQRVWQIDRGNIPVISMLNMKGGVGKTTLAYHLIGCLHDMQKVSVLLIDLDPQHNLSQQMMPPGRMEAAWDTGRSILSVFEPKRVDGFKHADFVAVDPIGLVPSPEQLSFPLRPGASRALKLDLVVGHFEIVKCSLSSAAASHDQMIDNFKRFVEQARRSYGLVVIDLNPGASFLTEAALEVSTHILAPVRPDRYSARGLKLLDRLMNGAFRLKNVPERIAVVNGVKRSGNQSVKDSEREVIEEIRAGPWRTLSAELGDSDLLRARPRPPRPDDDLTYWMAHRNWHIGGQAIRSELVAVAKELAGELGV